MLSFLALGIKAQLMQPDKLTQIPLLLVLNEVNKNVRWMMARPAKFTARKDQWLLFTLSAAGFSGPSPLHTKAGKGMEAPFAELYCGERLWLGKI